MLGVVTFLGILIAAVWFIVAYNQLVALKQRVTKDWAELDRLLRQRHDELSQLGEICARHLGGAQPALDRLGEARATVFGARHAQNPVALGRAESELRRAVAGVLALAAARPELAGGAPFTQLTQRIAALDEEIAARRNLYNASAGPYNVAIEEFPGRVVAALGGFDSYAPLDFDARPAGADALRGS